MRIHKSFVIFAAGAILFVYGIFYTFVMLFGRSFIAHRLEDLTQRKVSMVYFGLTPPFNLEIRQLKIQGMADIEYISFAPSIPRLLIGRIALNRIIVTNPKLFLERNPPEVVTSTEPPNKSDAATALKNALSFNPGASEKYYKKPRPRVILRRLNMKNGEVVFIDHTVGPDGIKITVNNINFRLNNIYVFPASVLTNFELDARIPWQEGKVEGKIHADGWINFVKKDMQANLKIEDIDGIYLYPYYSNWVDLEKARIQSAKLGFTSNIQGLDNNVTADCHLELTDIVRKNLTEGESEQKAAKITDAVLDMFRAMNQGKIVLNFTIRTKMDRPEFGFGNIRMAFEEKLTEASDKRFKPQDVLMFPAKMWEEGIKATTGISKAIIDSTFAVGGQIKKVISGHPAEKTDSKEKQPVQGATK